MIKIKLLLMSPFMSYSNRWGQYHRGAGDTFPQGIGAIAGYLEMHGIPVDVIEPDIEGMNLEEFYKYIETGNYNLIGISAFTTNISYAFQTAKFIKNINKNIHIVLGGAHPTLFPMETMENCSEIDYVILHEGEIPLLKLIQALENNTPLEEVPNLIFRENYSIKRSLNNCDWLDLNQLPLFPYHKFDPKKYIPAPSLRKVLPTFNYMAQRGCPFNCSFCDTRTHGKRVRYRSVDKVIEDLKILKKNYRLKGIIFEGSNFTVKSEWIRNLCHRMIEEELNLYWYSMGRVDFDLDILPLMKKSGLWCMSFGIESANQKSLKRMNKNINTHQVKVTLKTLRNLKIRTIGSFILGYPGEDENDLINTIQYACGLDLDVAVFFLPVPFPGTELYYDVIKTGGLRENICWDDYKAWIDHNHPIYINPLIGKKQIDLYNYAFRKFYVRPSYIYRQIMSIKNINDLKRLLRGFLSIEGLVRKC